jgi:hypothetical protein
MFYAKEGARFDASEGREVRDEANRSLPYLKHGPAFKPASTPLKPTICSVRSPPATASRGGGVDTEQVTINDLRLTPVSGSDHRPKDGGK